PRSVSKRCGDEGRSRCAGNRPGRGSRQSPQGANPHQQALENRADDGDHVHGADRPVSPSVAPPFSPMSGNFLSRMRTAVDASARAGRDEPAASPRATSAQVVGGPRITFADANASADVPATWLAVFELSVERATPVSREVLDTIRERAGKYEAEA